MTEPINTKSVGGVKYNANQVEKVETKKVNGQNINTIFFKGGEQLIFPDQKPREIETDHSPESERSKYENREYRNAKPEVNLDVVDGLCYDTTNFDIKDIMGATFKTSEQTISNVKLTDSEDTIIDLARNQSRWYSDSATIEGGKNNAVILDSEDTATINGKSVTGEGTASQKDY